MSTGVLVRSASLCCSALAAASVLLAGCGSRETATDPRATTATTASAAPEPAFRASAPMKAGAAVFLSKSKGLVFVNEKGAARTLGATCMAVTAAPDGALFCLDLDGVSQVTATGREVVAKLDSNSRLDTSSGGELWVGAPKAGKRRIVVHASQKLWELGEKNNAGLELRACVDVVNDADNVTWCVDHGQQLRRQRAAEFEVKASGVRAIARAPGGGIYFASVSSLSKYGQEGSKFIASVEVEGAVKMTVAPTGAVVLYQHQDGRITWVSPDGGKARMKRPVERAALDGRDRLWIASAGKVEVVTVDGKVLAVFREESLPGAGDVVALAVGLGGPDLTP